MDDRGLRDRLARAFARARRRQSDRERLSARDFLARRRPGTGAPLGFFAPLRAAAVKIEMAVDRRRRRFRGLLVGVEGDAARIRPDDAGEANDVLLPLADMADAKLVLDDALVAQALRRGKAAEREAKQAPQIESANRKPASFSPPRRITGTRAPTKESDRWPSAPTGSNCCRSRTPSPARNRSTAASSSPRWRMRSRKRRDRAMAPKPKCALRSTPRPARCGSSRHMLVVDQVENPRDQISLEDARKRQPAAQVGDTIADAAAAARIRPHRRAIGQAGDRAEGARGRARPAI